MLEARGLKEDYCFRFETTFQDFFQVAPPALDLNPYLKEGIDVIQSFLQNDRLRRLLSKANASWRQTILFVSWI